MKIRKTIKNKLKISIIIVMMAGLLFAKTVSAKTFLEAAGGVLMKPVLNFAMFIGDTIENALDGSLYAEANRPYYFNKAIEKVSAEYGGFLLDYEQSFFKKDIIEMDTLYQKLDMNIFTDDTFDAPMGTIYSPYEIFSNKIPLMDVNFLSPHVYKGKAIYYNQEGEKEILESDEEIDSSAGALQKVVSSWYVTLRNIAIVALLSILLYLGIRIVISSSSAEKATYKQTLFDWLIALILVFGMHYIMSFALTMTENISGILDNVTNTLIKVPIRVDSQISDWTHNMNVVTNLPGYVRLVAGIANSSGNTLVAVEYAIIYLIMIAYTVMFTIIYLKRVIYMAFLTIIAPITAVTYPFRRKKVAGGNAFSIWLREYIVNLLIQPIHLLLYAVTVGATMDLAAEHPIYAIIVLACLIPAEKMFIEIFGMRAPHYADTSSTMSSEKRMARMTAYTAGRVVGGIRRLGNSLLSAPGTAALRNTLKGNGNDNVRVESGDFETNGTLDAPTITAAGGSTVSNSEKKSGILGSTNTDNKNTQENKRNRFNLLQKIDNVSINDTQNANTVEEEEKTVSGSLISMAAGLVSEYSKNDIEDILGGKVTGAEIKKQSDISPAEILVNGNINVSNMDFSQVMKNVYPDYEKEGITSMREFKAAYAIEKSGASREEAIATYKVAQETGDIRGNAELEESWRNELSERLSKTKEMQQLISTQSNKIIEKYKNMEKTENNSENYKELTRKVERISDEIAKNKDKELEQVRNIPIRYADKVISKIETYYDNLD